MKHIAFWTEKGTLDETIKLLTDLALAHARLGGAEGERIAGCIISGDFPSLCDFTLDYAKCTVWQAKQCRQSLGLLVKLESLPLGIDKKTVAVKKFEEAEARCAETNHVFELRAQGSFQFEPWVESALSRARTKIARVLGDVPGFGDLKYRFGPGATTLTKKSDASVVEKLQAGISCSENLLPYASRVLEEMPHLTSLHSVANTSVLYDGTREWYDNHVDEYELQLQDEEGFQDRQDRVKYSVRVDHVPVSVTPGIVEFVPKNARTYRAIVKEGSLNTLVQLAFGDYISSRLSAFGLGIRDQSVNQDLARLGSIDGSYATLDLSSASDMIARAIVIELLPPDWAFALDCARSESVVLNGSTLVLEKFSSMGNGFTFPLETLIFWALSSSVADDGFASVYGDDIIVGGTSATRVMRLLEVCGFSINKEKSYWAGPFRESCGADYIKGMDIRPYYQKDLVGPVDLFRLHNFYVRQDEPDFAELVKAQINESLIIYGPDGFGDGHLLGVWTRRYSKKLRAGQYGGALFDTYKEVGRRDKRALRPGDRVLPVYTIYAREGGDRQMYRSLAHLKASLPFDDVSLDSWVLPEPLPERVSPVDGVSYKMPSYPGTDGYKKVTIYTLDLANSR